MGNRKDIGKAFNEKLVKLDKNPKADLWIAIEKDLETKNNKKLILWLLSIFILGSILFSLNYFNKFEIIGNKAKQENNNPIKNINLNKNGNLTDSVFKNDSIHSINSKVNKVMNSVNNRNDTHLTHTYSKLSKKSNSKNFKESSKNSKEQEPITSKQKYIKANNNLKKIKTYSTQTKRLVRSTDEYDEYEITKKHNYFVRKKGSKNTFSKNSIQKKHLKKEKSKVKKIKKQKQSKNKTIVQEEKIKLLPENNINDILTIKDTSKICITTDEKVKKIEKIKKIIDTTKIKEKEEEKSLNFDLYLTPYYGYNYYGNLKKGNSISNQDNYNNKGSSGNQYGFYARAMFTKKLGLRIGFAKTSLNHSTSHSKTRTNSPFLDLTNIELGPLISENTLNSQFSNDSKVTLTQKLDYLEMPIETYYILKDEKFGFATACGISCLFLKQKEIFIKSNTVSNQLIGNTTNIKTTSITANFNFIFSYKISESINLEMCPSIKYHFSGYNNVNGYSPFIISIQTGFSYKL